MRISMQLHFDADPEPIVTTGVAGYVTDMMLPNVGDTVHHRAPEGGLIAGRVRARDFFYDLSAGDDTDGIIVVTLQMDALPLH